MILIMSWAVPIQILFEKSYFVNIILILFCLLSLSFFAKGLAMCRFGGMITTQIMMFHTLINIGFEHFLCSNRSN